jgi:hypothetical protein
VWVDCSLCISETQYQLSSCTSLSDTVCKAYTFCDPQYQYILRRGDFDHDNLCSKTKCTSSTSRAMYEKSAAVDSTSYYVNGTDSVCAAYAACQAGTFMSFAGNDTHDAECEKCPAGSFSVGGVVGGSDSSSSSVYSTCTECSRGTYAPSAGATACEKCTLCSSVLNSSQQSSDVFKEALSWCAAGSACIPAAKKQCTPSSDAECVFCAADSGFGVVPATSAASPPAEENDLCVPCKIGYVYNESEALMGKRCVQCPPGSYCPSKDQVVECPGSFVYYLKKQLLSGLARVAVPSSPPGSWKLQQCNCNSLESGGGFQASEYSQALFGCVPCPNGTYASPGMQQCQDCP